MFFTSDMAGGGVGSTGGALSGSVSANLRWCGVLGEEGGKVKFCSHGGSPENYADRVGLPPIIRDARGVVNSEK